MKISVFMLIGLALLSVASRAALSTSDVDSARAKVPDHTDPENAKALKCNACAVVGHEVYTKLHALHTLRHRKPKYHEQIVALEEACGIVAREYGLNIVNGVPTLQFEHQSRAPYQAKGQWITSMLAQRCADLTDIHEAKMLRAMDRTENEREFLEMLCVRLDKSCVLSSGAEEL